MKLFSYILIMVITIAFLGSCKGKKDAPGPDDPLTFDQFAKAFPQKPTPYTFGDSSLTRKEKDSTQLKLKNLLQFVPDSIVNKVFGKIKPKMYPLARVDKDDQFLFVKAVAGEKRSVVVFAFDRKDNFITWLNIFPQDQLTNTSQEASMDGRGGFYKKINRKNADGSFNDGTDVFALDKSIPAFSLVATDPLDESQELINPIDTFARKHKFSGDYGSGKKSLFSFRDGRKADRLSFFIHFEKAGDCNGDLKGEAIFKSPTMAEYREPGDPCALQFTFKQNSVTVKEIAGCGARRGLRCSFDGVYSKRKGPVKKKK